MLSKIFYEIRSRIPLPCATYFTIISRILWEISARISSSISSGIPSKMDPGIPSKDAYKSSSEDIYKTFLKVFPSIIP